MHRTGTQYAALRSRWTVSPCSWAQCLSVRMSLSSLASPCRSCGSPAGSSSLQPDGNCSRLRILRAVSGPGIPRSRTDRRVLSPHDADHRGTGIDGGRHHAGQPAASRESPRDRLARRRGRRRPDRDRRHHLRLLPLCRGNRGSARGHGTNVLVRLSAFILLCIGIDILWSGYTRPPPRGRLETRVPSKCSGPAAQSVGENEACVASPACSQHWFCKAYFACRFSSLDRT